MEQILNQITSWKNQGQKIVFTNGVFDILHRGHVTYLQEAKKLGDKLIVGINSDDSVRKLNKGPERPINDQASRAYIIEALGCVDLSIIFTEDTPLKVINAILPDVLVKGGDYDPEEKNKNSKKYIVGSEEVLLRGGKVASIDLVDGFSTTGIIKKMKG